MMAQQPTDDDIDALMMVIPVADRSEALARLKGNNNNVEQAVNEYYDSPDSSQKYRYDESLFGMDREGTNNSPGVSFQVHSPDELAPSSQGRFDGAMSRPPSRVHNKSPLGNVIDLTTEHINGVYLLPKPRAPANILEAGGHQNPMYFDNDQDSDLQKAIDASRADMGLPPQETGTTDTELVHFGPANRPQYEPGKWDMVPLGISAREVILDPEPAERKRDLDAPAFLKPSLADNRLGALIMMYHAIPEIREVFIHRKSLLDDYGYNSEWWNGKDVDIVNLLGDVDEVENEVPVELQRLIAFLDKTDRSYGSVESLANLRDVKKQRRRGIELEPAVMAAWKASSGSNPAGVKKVFSRGVQCEAEEDGEGEEFAILELTLPPKESLTETIYDIADGALWLGNSELMDSAYLSHMASVVVFKLSAFSDYKNVDVPAVWYPDRYMKENRQTAWEMRVAQAKIHRELDRIGLLEDRLTSFPSRNGKLLKVQDLFAASLKHDKAEFNSAENRGHIDDDVEAMTFQRASKTANLSTQLQKLISSIDRKLKALNEEKEKAMSSLRELSQLYTKQSDEPGAPKLTKYLLRGVSTTKDVTYICRRPEPDLIEIDLDSETTKDKGDQWWKISYHTEGSNARAVVNKTSEETVLEVAKNGGSNILLVYASEKAMAADIKPLPQALDNFVKIDNSLFKQEFPSSPIENPTQISSPGKRKFDDSDCSSPVRESDRDYRNSVEPGVGWDNATQSASRNLNFRMSEEDDLVGINPSLLNREQGSEAKSVEMQERVNAPLMSRMRRAESDNASMETIDNMDLDDSVMEDSNTVVESPAVKQVNFRN